MSLTDQEIENIEARAELIAERVSERVITRILAAHVASCPHGRTLETWKQRIIGLGMMAALIAAGSSAGTAFILKMF